MVSIISSVKRDNRRSAKHENNYKNDYSGFAGELEKAIDERQAAECYTVTYNAKSQLQSFVYTQHRDYTV